MPNMKIKEAKKYILVEQFKKAKKILYPIANDNNAEAQLILGYLYYGGDDDSSSEDAEYWLKKSAENDNPEAMMYVATTIFEEDTTSSGAKDTASLPLLLEAANKGSAEAQRSLAVMYAHGESVPQSDEQTMYWDEKAATQGLAESQLDLALMLLNGYGKGGDRDVQKAIYWYEQAAKDDHNVPHAQWAAEALTEIFAGKPNYQYADRKKMIYWQKRSEYLERIDFRPHPDWFYEGF